MTQKVFVGGFGGSGTRVIQMILDRAGCNVESDNEFYDWGPHGFVWTFDRWYFRRSDSFRSFMLDQLGDKDGFSVKVGHLMYCIPQLKEWFPGSKFIYVYRNPWDQMSNDYKLHVRYGGLQEDAPLVDKVKYWCQVSREAMERADLSVSLERLVVAPETPIREILELVGVNDRPEKYADIIHRPATMGRASDSYSLISQLPQDTQQWLRGVPGVLTEAYDVF